MRWFADTLPVAGIAATIEKKTTRDFTATVREGISYCTSVTSRGHLIWLFDVRAPTEVSDAGKQTGLASLSLLLPFSAALFFTVRNAASTISAGVNGRTVPLHSPVDAARYVQSKGQHRRRMFQYDLSAPWGWTYVAGSLSGGSDGTGLLKSGYLRESRRVSGKPLYGRPGE